MRTSPRPSAPGISSKARISSTGDDPRIVDKILYDNAKALYGL
jgi:hypothetical protein